MWILLGVTGSISAYKAVELTRELTKRGAEVQVVMTEAATRFVAPLSFVSEASYAVCISRIAPEPPKARKGSEG
jgi:phosphopantothenoylcysteine decarboxylase/phosphopantothenate--cysteine ligase